MNLRKISALLVCMMLAASVLISAVYASSVTSTVDEGGANPTVTISGPSHTMDAGLTMQLTAAPAPSDCTVSWQSNNPNVTVSGGLVTAKDNASGNVTITATATKSGRSGTATYAITVNAKQVPPPAPSSPTPPVPSAPPAVTSKAPTTTSSAAANVNPASVTLQGPDAVEVGGVIGLMAVILPENANKTVSWLSSDTAVASVSHGRVTGVSPGTAVITVFTAKDNVKVSKTITVVPAGSLAGTSSVVSDVSSEAVSSTLALPVVSAVGQGDIYSGVEVVPPSSRASILGLIAWICIILGVVIVLLVLFSGKRPNAGLPGKKRYHRKSAGGHKKRLLDDRYYRNYRNK